jgi:hypothetical protein
MTLKRVPPAPPVTHTNTHISSTGHTHTHTYTHAGRSRKPSKRLVHALDPPTPKSLIKRPRVDGEGDEGEGEGGEEAGNGEDGGSPKTTGSNEEPSNKAKRGPPEPSVAWYELLPELLESDGFGLICSTRK